MNYFEDMENGTELMQLSEFMRRSNAIEGETEYIDHVERGVLHKNDVLVAGKALQLGKEGDALDKKTLLSWHKQLGAYLKEDGKVPEWVGRYRDVNVHVGRYAAPVPSKVPDLMKMYLSELWKMDAWEAHNEYQKIHPFQDLNGRIGRLIWLYKMVSQDKDPFQLQFLHAYYYQTLQHFDSSLHIYPHC